MEYLTALFIWISTAESVQQAKPWCDQYADIVEHPQKHSATNLPRLKIVAPRTS